MKILYVNSGFGWPHSAIDQYILNGFIESGAESKEYDLFSNLQFFYKSFELMEKNYRISMDYPYVKMVSANNLLLEISRFKPDLVVTMHGENLPVEVVDAVRQMNCKTALWVVEDPYELEVTTSLAQHYDYVFTTEENCLDQYKQVGCSNIFHIPLGTFPGIYNKQDVSEKYKSDICFIGNAFDKRLKIIDELADFLIQYKVKIIGWWWEKLANFDKLKPYIVNDFVDPYEAARYYNGAKINLNIHKSTNDSFNGRNKNLLHGISPNNRTFEIASCQAFQLIDADRIGIYSAYGDLAKKMTFGSPGDLIKKIEYYLVNVKEREEIARSMAEETLANHTYLKRVKLIQQLCS